jgi:hypothetical protein
MVQLGSRGCDKGGVVRRLLHVKESVVAKKKKRKKKREKKSFPDHVLTSYREADIIFIAIFGNSEGLYRPST